MNTSVENTNKTGTERIRLCFMLDSLEMPSWQYLMLQQIKQLSCVSIELIILNAVEKKRKRFFHWLLSNLQCFFYKCFIRIEKQIFAPKPDAFETATAAELLAGIPTLHIKPKQTKYSDYFDKKDIDAVKGYSIDIFIRLGFRILRGEILKSSRFGVWSFHHGDNQVNRGGPPAFWEVFENHPLTGSVLQILNEELDKGLLLFKSYSATDPVSISRNRNQLYWKTLSFIPRKLRELNMIGADAFMEKVNLENQHINFYHTKLYKEPSNKEFVSKFGAYLIKVAKHNFRNSLAFKENWFLMFRISDSISTSFWKFNKIIAPKDRFWADPHIFFKNGKYYIYFEEFIYSRNKGHISVIEMDDKGNYSKPSVALQTPHHLSYPFIFEWNDCIFMIPESSSNKTISIYKCVRFPDKWEFLKNIMSSVTAVDNTLLYYKEKWWLFANMQENPGASTLDELFIFYADSPLSEKWKPHSMNPVISDVRRARPAGKIIEFNNKLYRPSQDCSKGYGYGLKINQIKTLDENNYHEQEVDSISPGWSRGLEGVHTINYSNGLTVIDVKRRILKYGL